MSKNLTQLIGQRSKDKVVRSTYHYHSINSGLCIQIQKAKDSLKCVYIFFTSQGFTFTASLLVTLNLYIINVSVQH